MVHIQLDISQLWYQHPQDEWAQQVPPVHREEGQLPQQPEEDQVEQCPAQGDFEDVL